MSIWSIQATLENLNELSRNTMVEHIGIEFLEVGDDYIKARMPVDHRTVQPARLLHGGASVTLAETLGSVAANLCVDMSQKMCVGLDINANHVRSVTWFCLRRRQAYSHWCFDPGVGDSHHRRAGQTGVHFKADDGCVE